MHRELLLIGAILIGNHEGVFILTSILAWIIITHKSQLFTIGRKRDRTADIDQQLARLAAEYRCFIKCAVQMVLVSSNVVNEVDIV